MKSSVIVIVNPAARGVTKAKLALIAKFLKTRGLSAEIQLTEKKHHATDIAHSALQLKPDLIMAAGGDGTINEVVNGMAGSDIPLTILPIGTANVLAREIGISGSIETALEKAITGSPHNVSLGRIEIGNKSAACGRYFCLMAGIGFDGKTVFDAGKRLKEISGKGAYLYSGLKNFFSYPPPPVEIKAGNQLHQGYSAIICKASRYGGKHILAPDAKLTEPFFYALIFKGRERSALLRYVMGVVSGKAGHLRLPDVEYIKTTDIEIQGVSHIQIDGDYLGFTPARITIVPNALRLIY